MKHLRQNPAPISTPQTSSLWLLFLHAYIQVLTYQRKTHCEGLAYRGHGNITFEWTDCDVLKAAAPVSQLTSVVEYADAQCVLSVYVHSEMHKRYLGQHQTVDGQTGMLKTKTGTCRFGDIMALIAWFRLAPADLRVAKHNHFHWLCVNIPLAFNNYLLSISGSLAQHVLYPVFLPSSPTGHGRWLPLCEPSSAGGFLKFNGSFPFSPSLSAGS